MMPSAPVISSLFMVNLRAHWQTPKADAILVRAASLQQAEVVTARRLGLWHSTKNPQFHISPARKDYAQCRDSFLFLGPCHVVLALQHENQIIFRSTEDFRRQGFGARPLACFGTPEGQAVQYGQRWSTSTHEELRIALDKRKPLDV